MDAFCGRRNRQLGDQHGTRRQPDPLVVRRRSGIGVRPAPGLAGDRLAGRLECPELPVPALARHREVNGATACYDGGLLEISIDGGAFTQIPTAQIQAGRYTGAVSSRLEQSDRGPAGMVWSGAPVQPGGRRSFQLCRTQRPIPLPPWQRYLSRQGRLVYR